MTLTSQEKSQLIAKAASDKKALDIMIMNMHNMVAPRRGVCVGDSTNASS